MASNKEFRYVINTDLKLSSGSLNNLLKDVKSVDKRIRDTFESTRLKLNVGINKSESLSNIQREVKSIVTSYNNGQAPNIKLKLSIDSSGIGNIQKHVSNMKKELESMSRITIRPEVKYDDSKLEHHTPSHKDVSIHANVGIKQGEIEKIQRNLGNTQATIKVGLRLDESSLQAIQHQVNSVRADINAINRTVEVSQPNYPIRNTQQPQREQESPRFGAREQQQVVQRSTSTGRVSSTANNQIENISIWRDAHQSLKQQKEELKKALAHEDEIGKLQNELNKAKTRKAEGKKTILVPNAETGKNNQFKIDSYIKEREDKIKEYEAGLKKIAELDARKSQLESQLFNNDLHDWLNPANVVKREAKNPVNDAIKGVEKGRVINVRNYNETKAKIGQEQYNKQVYDEYISNKKSNIKMQDELAKLDPFYTKNTYRPTVNRVSQLKENSVLQDTLRQTSELQKDNEALQKKLEVARQNYKLVQDTYKEAEKREKEEAKAKKEKQKQKAKNESKNKANAEPAKPTNSNNSNTKPTNTKPVSTEPVNPSTQSRYHTDTGTQIFGTQMRIDSRRKMIDVLRGRIDTPEKRASLSDDERKSTLENIGRLQQEIGEYQRQLTTLKKQREEEEKSESSKNPKPNKQQETVKKPPTPKNEVSKKVSKSESNSGQKPLGEQIFSLQSKINSKQKIIDSIRSKIDTPEKRSLLSEDARRSILDNIGKAQREMGEHQRQLAVLNKKKEEEDARNKPDDDYRINELKAKTPLQQEKQIDTANIKAKKEDEARRMYRQTKQLQRWNKMSPEQQQEAIDKSWIAADAKNKKIDETNANKAKAEMAKIQSEAIKGNAKFDYDRGIVKFGGNKEYSAKSLESLLKNPNINYEDSLKILGHIDNLQANDAYRTGTNFSRNYQIRSFAQNSDGSFQLDEHGNKIEQVKNFTRAYNHLGEVIDNADRGFMKTAGNIMRNIATYSLVTQGFSLITQGVTNAIQQMAEFEVQIAKIKSIAMDFKTGQINSQFKSFGSTNEQVDANVTSDIYKISDKYGANATDTVLPIYQQVVSRNNLIQKPDGSMSKDYANKITDDIIKYSSIALGPGANPQDMQSMSQDMLSLYQAMYNGGFNKDTGNPTHIDKMSSMFDMMAVLNNNGVNTANIADALSEVAPEAIKRGIDPKDMVSLLGAYNLSDTDATGQSMTHIAKVFMGALANSRNDNIGGAMKILGINLNKDNLNQSDLMKKVLKNYQTLDSGQQSAVANIFGNVDGKGSANNAQMQKFLSAAGTSYYDNFGKSKDAAGAADEAWKNFADSLQVTLSGIGTQMTRFVKLLGALGALDSLKVLLGGFKAVLTTVNDFLDAMNKIGAAMDKDSFNVPKFVMQLLALTAAFKGLRALANMSPVGGIIGNALATATGGYSLGFKGKNVINPNASNNGSVANTVATVASNVIPFVTPNGHPVPTGSVQPRTSNANTRVNVNNIPKTSGAGNAIKEFFSDVFMLSSIKSAGGVKSAVSTAGQTGKDILVNLFKGFGTMLAPMRAFGLLLTRLTILGAALAGAWWLAKTAAKAYNDKINGENESNYKKIEKNGHKITEDDFSQWRKLQTKDFTNKASVDKLYSNDIEKLQTVEPLSKKEREELTKLNKKMKDAGVNVKWGDKYAENGSYSFIGDGQVEYMQKNKDGKPVKKIGSLDNNKEMDELLQTLRNNGDSPDSEALKPFRPDLSYLGDFKHELRDIGDITDSINESFRRMGYEVSKINFNFSGAENTPIAIQQKIAVMSETIGQTISKGRDLETERQSFVDRKQKATDEMSSMETKLRGAGISDDMITSVKNDYRDQRDAGDVKEIMGRYNYTPDDVDKKKKEYLNDKKHHYTEKEAEQKANDWAKTQDILGSFVEVLNSIMGFTDAEKKATDAIQSNNEVVLQQQQQLKELKASYIVASTGIDVYNAKLSKLQTATSKANTLVSLADTDHEKIGATVDAMHSTGDEIQTYRQELSSIQSAMANLRKSNPDQNFSIDYLYGNPDKGMTEQQMAYKQLLEQSNQVNSSMDSSISSLKQQKDSLKDLVLNSNKYAAMWERVQNRIKLVKDMNVELQNVKLDSTLVSNFADVKQSITGDNQSSYKVSQYESNRDRNLDIYQKLSTAMATYGSDSQELNKALQEVDNTMGNSFDNQVVKPLKDIVTNGFMQASGQFGQGVTSFQKAVDSFNTDMSNVVKDMDSSLNNMQQSMQQAIQTSNSMVTQASNASAGGIGAFDIGKSDPTGIMSEGHMQQMADTIRGTLKGRLTDYAMDYVQAGAKYNIDPRFLAAISMAENGGDSNILRRTNNVGSIAGDGYGGYKEYNTITDGIMDLARLLRVQYFDKGYNTIPTIQQRYAPEGASNDPNDTNGEWKGMVASFYSKMTGISKEQLLGSSSIPTNIISSSGGNAGGSNMFSWMESILNKQPSQGGLTYRWGGAHVQESFDEFIRKAVADCSGFVEQVYKKFAGINLGTTSSNGLLHDSQGTRVNDKSQLSKGDLVFFGSGDTASHVGIYAGDNQFYSMTHDGEPLRKQKMWGNYIGGKHYTTFDATVQSNNNAQVQAVNELRQAYLQAIDDEARAISEKPNVLTSSYRDALTSAKAQASINDVYGATGDMQRYDSTQQTRIDVFKEYEDDNRKLQEYTAARNDAMSKGDTEAASHFNSLIDAIQKAIQGLSDFEKGLKAVADQDPRYNTSVSSQLTHDALARLTSSQNMDTADYSRLVKEINTMLSDYATNSSKADDMEQLWKKTGAAPTQMNYFRRQAYGEQIVLNLSQIKQMNELLSRFADGTNNWYATMTDALDVMRQIRQLEKDRADNAKEYYKLTGRGLESYVIQQAKNDVTQSDQDKPNLKKAIDYYKTGKTGSGYGFETSYWNNDESGMTSAKTVQDRLKQKYGVDTEIFQNAEGGLALRTTSKDLSLERVQGIQDALKNEFGLLMHQYTGGQNYGLQTSYWANNDFGFTSAHTVKDDLKKTFGIDSEVYNRDDGNIGVRYNQNDLSKEQVDEITKYLKDKYQLISWGTGSDSLASTFEQQMASLQMIADIHDTMIQKMNDYRNAVVGGFKAGAMSLGEYLDKMDNLRDLQSESKDQALQMVDTIQSGFQNTLASALQSGMSGNMDSTQSFMDGIKQTLSGAVSSQLSTTLLNNTGLQDVMNNLMTNITSAATTGSPDDIVNMFKNNDFGKQMNDAMAPFLPLIEQIVSSTDGIFATMKDQVYNSASGFKTDSYLYDYAKGESYDGIKNWLGGKDGKNESGSNTSGNGSNGSGSPVQTPDKYKTTSADVQFRADASIKDNNIIETIPKGTQVKFLNEDDNGFTKIEYDGKTGWVDKNYVYHTGGIAGIMNFSSPQGLKSDELMAIMQKGEVALQPKQIQALATMGSGTSSIGGSTQININVKVEGSGFDQQGIENAIQTAVQKSIAEVNRQGRLNNLTMQGTSYRQF